MPRVPSTSPATGAPTPAHYIHTTASSFVDSAGRTLLLRGVNLSGSSKAPVGQPSYVLEGFWEEGEKGSERFIGRPLNLDDGSADIHLARLRGWGFNFLRFPVSWEAIEHAGPGKYDDEFIQYTIRVLRKCKEYGFRVYMDPHQDTWSRFSGGSGAPFWTLPACGFNPRNITATQAAILHCEYPLPHEPDPAALPAMIWSTNYGRLLSHTVFTLFFAGRDFAPNCIIDGQNIQDYLQSHFIEAMGHLADQIRAADGGALLDDCVIGWDTMNEPFEGFCGWDNLGANPTKQGSTLKKGTHPTPIQSLRLGMGQEQTVENWTFGVFGPSRQGSVTIDPKGRKVWANVAEDGIGERADGYHPRWGWHRDTTRWPLGTCVWAQHGVWDVETGYLIRPDYFKYNADGDEIEFIADYWKPHFLAYAARIRRSHPEAILFVQPPVFAPPPEISAEVLRGRCAYATHYYDGLTLVTRHWNWFNADALGLLRGKYKSALEAVKVGESAIRRSLQQQLALLKSDAAVLGEFPTVIGEIGTPFDMDGKQSYGWTNHGRYKGDYSSQERALDASLNGCDGVNALSYTIWTYCADNTHEWGDGWNMEDLSLWSLDDLRSAEETERTGDLGSDGGSSTSVEDTATLLEGDKAGLLEDGAMLKVPVLVKGPELRRRTTSESSRNSRQQYRCSPTVATDSSLSLDKDPSSDTSFFAPSPSLVSVTAASSISKLSKKAKPELKEIPPHLRIVEGMYSSEYVRSDARFRLAGYSENPYEFLTDGARAVRAFCRPGPVKVVGRVRNMDFNISKAEFKLEVDVCSDDELVPQAEEVGSQEDDEWTGKAGEALATEIYVPLVHYANAKILEGEPASTLESSSASSVSEVTVDIKGVEIMGTGDEDDASEKRKREHSEQTRAAPFAVSGDDLVDVDVRVSTGRWTVRGQTLRWWYDVPREGEPSQTYSIDIKRRGGAIDPGRVRRRMLRGATPDKEDSCCDRLCNDGCVVV